MAKPAYQIERTPFEPRRIAAMLSHMPEESPTPLQQHALYGAALGALGAEVEHIAIMSNGALVMQGLFLARRFFGIIRLTSAFRGPLWADGVADSEKENIWAFLRTQFSPWRWNFLTLMPELENTPDNRRLMRRAGFIRLLTGSSTIWFDTRPGEEDLLSHLDGKWRNQLKKARQANLEISVGGTKPKHYNWLLEREREQRDGRGYSAAPLGLVPAYCDAARTVSTAAPILVVSAAESGTRVAGALFLLHGNSATYHIGWSSARGRADNALNLILFRAVEELRDKGIRWLDMGGIETSAGPGAGIARFKLGLGTAPFTLIGTYLG